VLWSLSGNAEIVLTLTAGAILLLGVERWRTTGSRLALVMASGQVVALPPLLRFAGPAYVHLFLVGWVTQLIMGIVFWMFPKWSKERPRGSERLALATYLLLNAGLLLRVVGEPARAVDLAPLWGWLLVASALLQWLAGVRQEIWQPTRRPA
jgi:predicted membrane channel-forming protein YqfA (hemolysin III family)